MVWKDFKKWLGIMAVGATALMPINKMRADDIEINNYAGSGVGGSVLNIGHYDGTTEGYDEGYDAKWMDAPENPNSQWLEIYTAPEGDEFLYDYRGLDSKTTFQCKMKGVSTSGNIACTNYVLFNFLDEDTNRIYRYSFNMPSNYSANGQAFNVSGILTNQTRINTPGISNLPNNALAWTMDIVSQQRITSSTAHGYITPPGNTNQVSTNVAYGDAYTNTVSPTTNAITTGKRAVLKGVNVTGHNYTQP